jgi:hypothetical protein
MYFREISSIIKAKLYISCFAVDGNFGSKVPVTIGFSVKRVIEV